ncbi:hypothetical protein [Amylibacter sp. IMCC11727]|nr:hypothetical protein [Amylibacter sp. IMCC11727]WGI20708.1 hypothetical protein QBD29_11355 [Amylibacter sp. IMCC11727]
MLKATKIGTYITLGAVYVAPLLGADKTVCVAAISGAYFLLAALTIPSH